MAIRKRAWIAPNGEQKQAWLVDYRDQAGKRRAKQFTRRKDAEEWKVTAAYEVRQGTHTPDSQTITVGHAADLWVRSAELRDRERGTVDQYKQLARLHIKPLIGGVKLSRLSVARVAAFRDELLETRSKSMAAKAVRALSLILNDAQERGLVAQNIARKVKVGQSTRETILVPTKAELQALIKNAPADLKPIILTAIFTGLRASELRGLRWCDVDLKGNTLTVAQRADKFGKIGPPKSKAGNRSIPLPAVLVSELREWKLRCPRGPLGLAFPNTVGGVQDYGHLLRRKFFPLQIAAGVCDHIVVEGQPQLDKEGRAVVQARYGLHSLRHAAASAWIKQRIDLKRLQTWMGHSSVQITLDVYGHLISDPAGDAALMEAAQAELFA